MRTFNGKKYSSIKTLGHRGDAAALARILRRAGISVKAIHSPQTMFFSSYYEVYVPTGQEKKAKRILKEHAKTIHQPREVKL